MNIMEIGDHIVFSYKKKELEGLVIKIGDHITIKLDSGYNIVVPKKELTITKTTKSKKKLAPKKDHKQKKGLPIKILHTGGTIASKVDYSTGAVIAGFTEEDILRLFPELMDIAHITSELIGNIQSEMMRFEHWNILAHGVEKAIKEGAQGVIITHGTDIIHMSAAALAFALENVPIPVLFVGSQRSSDRPSADAASNLLSAATFIAEHGKEFQGVGLCLHEGINNDTCAIFPGLRTRKMHTSRRDAFKPINDSPFARITYPDLKIERVKQYPKASGKFIVRPFKDVKVGILHIHPHMFVEQFCVYEQFDGVVLSLTGIGHAPTMQTDKHNAENEKIAQEIAKLAKKMPVVAAPQTIFGRIDMNVYSPGRQLIDMGVLGQGLDMTPETAFVKLAWLLSNEPKKARELYSENLRGEISQRIEKNQYL